MRRFFYFLTFSLILILYSCANDNVSENKVPISSSVNKESNTEDLENEEDDEENLQSYEELIEKSYNPETRELAEYIPKDAIYAAKINVANLIKKGGLTVEGEEIKIPNQISKFLKIKEPSITNPFDLSSGAFIFGNRNFKYAIIAKLAKSDTTSSIPNFKLFKFTNKSGIQYTKINDKDFILIKDKVFLFASFNGKIEQDSAISTIRSIVDNKSVNTSMMANISGDEDIIFNVDFVQASKVQRSLKDLRILASSTTAKLNFIDNKIIFNYKVNLKNSNPFVLLAKSLISKCSTSSLKYFPESTNAIAGFSLNGKVLKTAGIFKYLKNVYPNLLKEYPVCEILELINGNIVIGAAVDAQPILSKAALTIESSNPKKLMELIVSVKEDLFSKNGDEYSLSLLPIITLKAIGNHVILSNTSGEYENSLANNKEISELFNNNLFGSYLNSSLIEPTVGILKQFNLINNIAFIFNIKFDTSVNIKSLEEGELVFRAKDCGDRSIFQYLYDYSLSFIE